MKEFMEYTENKMNTDVVIGSNCKINEYCGLPSLPKNPQTTMAYVPFQTDTTMYEPEMALKYGTAYPNLNKPFVGGKCHE